MVGCPSGRSLIALSLVFHQVAQASPDSFDFFERVGRNLAPVPFLPLNSRAQHVPDSFDSLALYKENIIFFVQKANESNESGDDGTCDSLSNNGQDAILTPTPACNGARGDECGHNASQIASSASLPQSVHVEMMLCKPQWHPEPQELEKA